MADAPALQPHDKVQIGGYPAVVSLIKGPGEIEVVYLDDRDRALHTDAIWRVAFWIFKHSGRPGRYVVGDPRLAPFVSKLTEAPSR